MTDREIIQGLIDRDNCVTARFFYKDCRPLLTAIMHIVFGRNADYDEMVSELYDYLMEDDCRKLRQFQYRSSLYQWLKVVATRFFIRQRDTVVETGTNAPAYEKAGDESQCDTAGNVTMRIDVANMLDLMENRRYADVVRHLVLMDEEPEQYASQAGISVDNLYNLKRRAMAAFTRIALKYYTPSYGYSR